MFDQVSLLVTNWIYSIIYYSS